LGKVEAIRQAVIIFGGQQKMAAALGVSQPTVSGWMGRDGQIGARYALPCHMLTSGRVKAYDLRPDLYPRTYIQIKRVSSVNNVEASL